MQNEATAEDRSIEVLLDERNKFVSLIELLRQNEDQTYNFDGIYRAILPESKTPISDSNLSLDDIHKLDRFGCFLTW